MGNNSNCCRICKEDKTIKMDEIIDEPNGGNGDEAIAQEEKIKKLYRLNSSNLSNSLNSEINRNIVKLSKKVNYISKCKEGKSGVEAKANFEFIHSNIYINPVNEEFLGNIIITEDDIENKLPSSKRKLSNHEDKFVQSGFNPSNNQHNNKIHHQQHLAIESNYSYSERSSNSSFSEFSKSIKSTSNKKAKHGFNHNNKNVAFQNQEYVLIKPIQITKPFDPTSPRDIKRITGFKYFKTICKDKDDQQYSHGMNDTLLLKTTIKKLFRTGIKNIMSYLTIFMAVTKEKILIYKSEESFALMEKQIDSIKISNIVKLKLSSEGNKEVCLIDYIRVNSKKEVIRKILEFTIENERQEEFLSLVYYLMITDCGKKSFECVGNLTQTNQTGNHTYHSKEDKNYKEIKEFKESKDFKVEKLGKNVEGIGSIEFAEDLYVEGNEDLDLESSVKLTKSAVKTEGKRVTKSGILRNQGNILNNPEETNLNINTEEYNVNNQGLANITKPLINPITKSPHPQQINYDLNQLIHLTD